MAADLSEEVKHSYNLDENTSTHSFPFHLTNYFLPFSIRSIWVLEVLLNSHCDCIQTCPLTLPLCSINALKNINKFLTYQRTKIRGRHIRMDTVPMLKSVTFELNEFHLNTVSNPGKRKYLRQ